MATEQAAERRAELHEFVDREFDRLNTRQHIIMLRLPERLARDRVQLIQATLQILIDHSLIAWAPLIERAKAVTSRTRG